MTLGLGLGLAPRERIDFFYQAMYSPGNAQGCHHRSHTHVRQVFTRCIVVDPEGEMVLSSRIKRTERKQLLGAHRIYRL